MASNGDERLLSDQSNGQVFRCPIDYFNRFHKARDDDQTVYRKEHRVGRKAGTKTKALEFLEVELVADFQTIQRSSAPGQFQHIPRLFVPAEIRAIVGRR